MGGLALCMHRESERGRNPSQGAGAAGDGMRPGKNQGAQQPATMMLVRSGSWGCNWAGVRAQAGNGPQPVGLWLLFSVACVGAGDCCVHGITQSWSCRPKGQKQCLERVSADCRSGRNRCCGRNSALNSPGRALMEPWPFSHGYTESPGDACPAVCSFNGAMTLQPWIHVGSPHVVHPGIALQWSHGPSAMDT